MHLFYKKAFGLIWLLAGMLSLRGQSVALEQYIDTGLQNNLVIRQKQIAIQQALLGLEQAKALYKPAIDFLGSFQDGGGGRSISLPIGDLMNPVYATLNQLTASNKFPAISNTESYFLPQQFTDLKIQAVMPVYNTALRYNTEIKTGQLAIQETEMELYRRELVNSIRQAYYQYLLSLEAIKIYESAKTLANEGLRTNQKLLEAGKGLPAYVSRAEAEVEQLNAQLFEARKTSENAKAYFNLLLNREKEVDISSDLNNASALRQVLAQLMLKERAGNPREEIDLFTKATAVQQTVLNMNRSFAKPKLNAFANSGIQAERFNFGSKSPYYILGLHLEVPLYKGKSNLMKIRQSQLELETLQSKTQETKQKLDLSLQVAKNQLQSAHTNYLSASKQLESTATYQRLIEKGFREGVNSFIETVDARNQLVIAQLKLNLSFYKLLMASSQLEREQASYQFKK